MTKSDPPYRADPERIRAQAAMRAPLPKRFYTDVTVRQGDDGWSILLDGRVVKTPGKRQLTLPNETLAEAVAAEWRAQETVIDPGTMHVTRIVNSGLEAVADKMDDVEADIVAFAGSDLLCYRAAGPGALVSRQAAAWDPIVLWAATELGARFVLAEGVMHVEQPKAAIDRIADAVRGHSALQLAGLHVVTTLTGSALLALAVRRGRLTPADAWAAAHADEDYQIENWGADEEAAARRAYRGQEMQAACLVLAHGG